MGIRGGVTNPKPLGLGEASIFTKSPNELAIVLNTPFCILRTLDKTRITSYNVCYTKLLRYPYYDDLLQSREFVNAISKKRGFKLTIAEYLKELQNSVRKTINDIDNELEHFNP